MKEEAKIEQNTTTNKGGIYKRYFKRLLDIVLSLIALTILSPVFLILAIVGAIRMKGNPFFIQERTGLNGEIFKLIKLRTMSNAKDKEGNLLPNEVRLNKYGRILRSTSLDELPELINILIGDMSIVGPRPLLPEYLPFYTKEEQRRHDMRPGLTGLAQINGRNAISSWEERFDYDLQYVRNCTLILDIKIILKTVVKVVKRSDILVGSTVTVGRLDEEREKNIKTVNNKK